MIGKKPGLGPDNGEATSVIGENSAFQGTLEVDGNLRVDGKFSGTLRITETVHVGKNGFVDAEVHTRSAVVAGTIKGNLHASEKITLQSGSRLEGEMVTARLVIEEGVSFQGSCNTAKGAATGPARKSDTSRDEAKTVQDKIEQVAEALSKK
ncbi:MAG: bactofilin family protein [Candidatus Eiseniibacteriota bacterium]